MKAFIATMLLCLLAIGATLMAQEPQLISYKGETYSTQKPPATYESLTKGCTETGETLEVNGVVTKVWCTKPTAKFPQGRVFIILPKKSKDGNTNGVRRFFLYKAEEGK